MDHKSDNEDETMVKAGTLMCPLCCVKYVEIKVDFEYEGAILRDIKMLQCPVCQEEIFTPEQHEIIRTRFIQTQE